MCSVIRLLQRLCALVDAALELVRAGPAPRPLVLILLDGTRARNAPDRRIARIVQRVVRDLVHDYVRLQASGIPVHDRMDLPDAVPFRPLDPLRICTRERLLAPDAGNPGIVGSQRTLERLDLADVAAAIRVALPEVRALLDRLVRDGDDLGALEPEAVALDETVPRLIGLPEEELRIELDDRDVEPELAED